MPKLLQKNKNKPSILPIPQHPWQIRKPIRWKSELNQNWGSTLKLFALLVCLVFAPLGTNRDHFTRILQSQQQQQPRDLQAGSRGINSRCLQDTATNISSLPCDSYPKLQVALTTSANGLDYAMRFWANSLANGWHQDFEDVAVYTFDPVPTQGPLSQVLTQLPPLFHGEKLKQNNNLLLASIEAIYQRNPYADWYLLAEDDTIIIKENLLHAIDKLKLSPQVDFIGGLCATGSTRAINASVEMDVTFIIGGSGILLSNSLVQKMVPHVATCRKRFNKMAYGDLRIGACITHEVGLQLDFCQICKHYWMINQNVTAAIHRWQNDTVLSQWRVISMHEKDPQRIRLLNEWIRARPANKITFQEMVESNLEQELVLDKS